MFEIPKKKVGRPTRYHHSLVERAYKLALLGLRNEDLAVAFGVAEGTINDWLAKHEEFREAVKRGRAEADAQVAHSLYHRAVGYSCPEEKILVIKGEPVKIETIKYYPPDTTAAIFWLQNRQKEFWRDVRHHRISGEDGGPIKHEHAIVDIDLSDLTDEELEMLEKLGVTLRTKRKEQNAQQEESSE